MAERTVAAYLAARPADVTKLLKDLRALVLGTLVGGEERMKYGAPVYWNAAGEEVVYLYGGRDHANLGFLKGARLKDPAGLLRGAGVSGRHVRLTAGHEMPVQDLKELLRQCA